MVVREEEEDGGDFEVNMAALLERSPNPTDDEIDAAMAGNFCRCGTYNRIRAAIRLAAQTSAQAPPAATEAPADEPAAAPAKEPTP